MQLDGVPPSERPQGASVGSSVRRRRAQFRALYPRLKLEEMRGNVDTRINKLRAGLYDAAVFAAAWLKTLGRPSQVGFLLRIDPMSPPARQCLVRLPATPAHTPGNRSHNPP